MKHVFAFILVLGFYCQSRAQVSWINPQSYLTVAAQAGGQEPFPIRNGFTSTLYGALYTPQSPMQIFSFQYRPGRTDVPFFPKDISAKAEVSYRFQDHAAPLIFVMPGLGGTATGPNSQNFAEIYYNLGYHVVVVPNTVTPEFTLQISRDGLVGYLPRDARDLYDFLIRLNVELDTLKHAPITSYSLTGFSLGGLVAVYIAQIDEQERQFNFQKIGIFNPPLDMTYSIRKLDEIYNPDPSVLEVERALLGEQSLKYMEGQDITPQLVTLGKVRLKLGFDALQETLTTEMTIPVSEKMKLAPKDYNKELSRRTNLAFFSMNKIIQNQFTYITPEEKTQIEQLKATGQKSELKALYKQIRVRNEKRFDDLVKWGVGLAFRKSLTDLIKMSRIINPELYSGPIAQANGGIDPFAEPHMTLGGTSDISFQEYTDKAIVPIISKEEHISRSEIFKRTSMMQMKSWLKKNPKVYFFHNVDDFLFEVKGAREFVNSTFHGHAYIFPYGGHCGNYWFAPNLQAITESFKIQ